MGEFYKENWDLQAVVGGSNNDASITDMENPQFSFDPWTWSLQHVEEDLMSFPEIFETNPKVLDELDELYKPFYSELNPYSTQTIISSSPPVQVHVDEPVKQEKRQSFSLSAVSGTKKDSTKPKRFSRKNKQNRVVQHVTADDLPSDTWAWRKYGQKPIKGSPYPRSYYRCSSSKGCLARKQVERCCSDPRILIVSYTGEHNSHGQPTRRSSLAGSTRNKSLTSAPKTSLASKYEPHAGTVLLSPTTIKLHEPVKQESIKMVELQMLELHGDQEGSKILTPPVPDKMMSDELVHQNLDNFEGLFLDQLPDLSHEAWWALNESTTLTGGSS